MGAGLDGQLADARRPARFGPKVSRRQVSWLTGLVVRVAFPEKLQWLCDADFPFTVAGAATARRRIPCSPRSRGDRLKSLQ